MVDIYFGCIGESGHSLWPSSLNKEYWDLAKSFDGSLCPNGRKGYAARFWYLEDFKLYAVSFWDYTVDSRLNSHSTFFTDQKMDTKDMLPYFEKIYPEVFKRLPEIKLLHDNFITTTAAESKGRNL